MKKLQKILCPVDFSEFSRRAFDRAIAIARAEGSDVTALHVVPIQTQGPILPYAGPESLAPFPLPVVDFDRIKAELRSFLAIDSTLPLTVGCEVTEAPDVPREVLVHARRLPADLIVMGTHGRSGFNRLVLGSVTEKILRQAPMPVLTVPPSSPEALPVGRQPFRRVLCALDFSDCSLLGLQYAIELARQHKARLSVLHVVESVPVGYDPLVGPATDLAGFKTAAEVITRDRIHGLVSGADREAMYIEEIVVAGKAHREIVRIAGEWCADLIVLGVHGRSAVGRALFGSTVEPVVRHAECPVLTVRSEAHAATAAA